MAEHGKYCPIMVAGGNMYVSQCIGKDCTWWLPCQEALTTAKCAVSDFYGRMNNG